MKNSARIWKRTRSVIGMFLMIEASQFNFIGRCRKLGSRGRMRAKKGETKSTHFSSGLEGSEAETYLQLVSLPQSSSFLNSSGR
jgi:hypothetical protein